jgi:hypothetical protein
MKMMKKTDEDDGESFEEWRGFTEGEKRRRRKNELSGRSLKLIWQFYRRI